MASRSRRPVRTGGPVVDTADAARRFLLWGLLPGWFVPGLADWVMHRRTRIEDTAGTKESLIHAAMMAEIGGPLLAALVLEINPLLLGLMAGTAVVHEATAAWDVATAEDSPRELRPAEQMIHSFLETLPFTAVASLTVLHWDQLRELRRRDAWTLRPKRRPVPRGYLASVAAASLGCIALPYGEELLRCRRAARRRLGRS